MDSSARLLETIALSTRQRRHLPGAARQTIRSCLRGIILFSVLGFQYSVWFSFFGSQLAKLLRSSSLLFRYFQVYSFKFSFVPGLLHHTALGRKSLVIRVRLASALRLQSSLHH